MAIYEALGASPEGSIAVKLSTGEPGSNYLRADLIGELVQLLDASIVECNTAYGGSRVSTAMRYQVAEDHGYTAIAAVGYYGREWFYDAASHRGKQPDRELCRKKFCRL